MLLLTLLNIVTAISVRDIYRRAKNKSVPMSYTIPKDKKRKNLFMEIGIYLEHLHDDDLHKSCPPGQ